MDKITVLGKIKAIAEAEAQNTQLPEHEVVMRGDSTLKIVLLISLVTIVVGGIAFLIMRKISKM